MSGFEIYEFLRQFDLLKNSPKYWWPEVGSERALVSVILTQNTKWENVQKSLNNLGDITLDYLIDIDVNELAYLIKPSGFYNQKAKRIKLLAQNIIDKYNNFNYFKENVSREWLLSQKGIGFESADAILCYVCFREEFVVDKYTQKLLSFLGYEFENYDDIKYFFTSSCEENFYKVADEYENNLNLFYARLHGMIVEFMKIKNNINYLKELK